MMNNSNELLSNKINKGVYKAIAEAIEKHRKLGEAIAVWQNGEVVILSSDQIPNLENQNSSLH
jgi:hypothetical protein